MQEILPGIYHWTAFHEGIQEVVHSYYLEAIDPAVLIDPRLPAEGLGWFQTHQPPRHSYLTNRHHYRHSAQFAHAYGTQIWCHQAGLPEFTPDQAVKPFAHGDVLPGGVLALEVGVLCPEETALFIPCSGGILAIGDALIRNNDHLDFVPDPLLGDDPKVIKRGLRAVFRQHLARDFDHLLLAHGTPWIHGAKAALQRFLEEFPA